MKILAIADATNVRSGWGRYANHVVNETRDKGIVMPVISNFSDSFSHTPLQNEYPILRQPFSFKNAIKNILKIRKYLTRDVDAVHAFDCWPFAVYAMIALIGKNIPLFITGVGTYSLPPIRKSFKSWLMKRAYRLSKEIFCISTYTLDLIKERVGKANYSIVHWGTTPLPRLTDAEMNDYRTSFNIDKSAFPIILTVGEIKHRKGQFDTLKAVSVLKSEYSNILYITLGSTANKSYISKMLDFVEKNNLKDSFKIVDSCKDNKCLAFFYNLETIFAMNSNNEGDHFEGFGLVFLEAAKFGKPAVGSRGCGIEDVIVDGKTGYLCNQGDANDIAQKIDMVLSRKDELGEAAQERSKEFTWERTVSKHIDSYKKYAS